MAGRTGAGRGRPGGGGIGRVGGIGAGWWPLDRSGPSTRSRRRLARVSLGQPAGSGASASGDTGSVLRPPPVRVRVGARVGGTRRALFPGRTGCRSPYRRPHDPDPAAPGLRWPPSRDRECVPWSRSGATTPCVSDRCCSPWWTRPRATRSPTTVGTSGPLLRRAAWSAPGCSPGAAGSATRELKDLRFPADTPADAAVADPVDAGSYLATYFIHKGHEAEHFAWANKQVFELYENGRGFEERHHAHTSLYFTTGDDAPRPGRRPRPHGARPPVRRAGQRPPGPGGRRGPGRVPGLVRPGGGPAPVRRRRGRHAVTGRPGGALAPDHPQGRGGQRPDEAGHRARHPGPQPCS